VVVADLTAMFSVQIRQRGAAYFVDAAIALVLHAAYAPLAAAGLNFSNATVTEDRVRERIATRRRIRPAVRGTSRRHGATPHERR
jgi:hypothetical protein